MSHDKVYYSILEVLPGCIISGDVSSFASILEGKISEPMKVCVETAVRFYVMETLCEGTTTDLSQITAVCKLTCELARQELCLPTLPMLVISDAFDSLTVQQCEKLFSFVEANVSVWKEPLFFTPSKNQVLRMCNDVLRRLSRSQNTIFCGRILLFLARFFPFSERSGLNLISEFNLENVTTFSAADGEDPMDTSDVKEEGTSDAKDEKDEESKPTLDPTLYAKFWALQDFFRNPIQCYQKEPWRLFTSYTADVLEAFSSFKLESEGRGGEGSDSRDVPCFYNDLTPESGDADTTIIDTLPDVKKIDQYFAKFLTNQRLLELQFSDSNFRRYVLVQLLILCHYLTAAIKFKQESLGEGETQWVHSTEQRVFALLKETPPDGEEFVDIIKKILKREDFWNDWKNSGCPEIKDPAAPAAVNGVAGDVITEDDAKDVKKGKKRKLGDIFREADARKKFVMANPEMTRLWNLCPDNVAATRQSRRDFIPSLESYFVKAVEQIHCGEEPITERLVHDSDFGWRGLRLLACRSPHFFTQSTAPIATLPEYLTTMIKKLAKDIPGLSMKLQQIQEKLASLQQQKREQQQQQGHTDAPKQEEDEKIVTEETERCDEEETQDDENERSELQPITTEEQAALAAKLASIGGDKWRLLIRKLGFQDDEVDYILEQKKGKVQDAALHFLQLWVENEGEEANKETIVYTLGGLKMQDLADTVFN